MNVPEEIVRALRNPAFYPHRPNEVRHIQTHISHLFIALPYAYKLKKPVRFDFLDFSSPERRRYFCEEELRLNRRLCPAIYLDVVPLTRAPHGSLALAGRGPAVDHLVRMRALPEHGMLPVALGEGCVSRDRLEHLGRQLAAFHAACDSGPEIAAQGTPEVVAMHWQKVQQCVATMADDLLPRLDCEILADFGPSFVQRHDTLLRTRSLAGRIREGHGDLHAGNLCLIERELPSLPDAPAVEAGLYAFDCIEFSRELRACDVASEVAFLAMDLEWRGRADLATAFVASYVAAAGDRDLTLLLPYYIAYRAMVRGMVDGLNQRDASRDLAERTAAAERAQRRFRLAVHCAWRAAGPAILACRGLSGSGKTTLALALAARTGFRHLSSDEIRKRRAGLDPHLPAPPEMLTQLYSESARRNTYATLAAAVEGAIASGEPVIADATFTRREERVRIAEVAARYGCPWIVLDCEAPPDQIRTRLHERTTHGRATGEPALSDANWSVYLQQAASAEALSADEPALRVDTGDEPERVAERTLRALWSWRRTQPVRV